RPGVQERGCAPRGRGVGDATAARDRRGERVGRSDLRRTHRPLERGSRRERGTSGRGGHPLRPARVPRASEVRIGVAAMRRYVVAHQGYAARFRRATGDDIAAEIARLQAVQLDSIATVDRSHRLTLSSRVGGYEESEVSRLL